MPVAWYGAQEKDSGRWKSGNPAKSNGAGFPLSHRPGGYGWMAF
jgi:membrane-associated PAP2 superfamily phosphatase